MKHVIRIAFVILLAGVFSWLLIGSGVQPEPFTPMQLPTLEVTP